MKGVLERGVAAGAARAAAVRGRVAAAAQGVPGVSARIEGDGVVLGGRGLVRRSIVDPALRDIAGWGR